MAPNFHERAAAGRRTSDRARLPRPARLRLRRPAAALAPSPARESGRPGGVGCGGPPCRSGVLGPGREQWADFSRQGGQPCPEASRAAIRGVSCGRAPGLEEFPRPRGGRAGPALDPSGFRGPLAIPGGLPLSHRPRTPPAAHPVPIWLCFEQGRLDLLFPEVTLTRRPGAWGRATGNVQFTEGPSEGAADRTPCPFCA